MNIRNAVLVCICAQLLQPTHASAESGESRLKLFCQIQNEKIVTYFLATGKGFSMVSNIEVRMMVARGHTKLYGKAKGIRSQIPRFDSFTLLEHRDIDFIRNNFSTLIAQSPEKNIISILKGPIFDDLNVELVETLKLKIKYIKIDLNQHELTKEPYSVIEEELTFGFK